MPAIQKVLSNAGELGAPSAGELAAGQIHDDLFALPRCPGIREWFGRDWIAAAVEVRISHDHGILSIGAGSVDSTLKTGEKAVVFALI